MRKISTTFQYGDHLCTLETGRIARQASGSVLISMGDTVLLVAVTGKKEVKPDQDFFPLTVNYQEKTYAAGKIPGGFFKREGRPSESETLICRLIDRPIRPLFPAGFKNEVQIVATVVSIDEKVPADIPAIIGSAAALAVSGLPFNGPLAAARVGFKDGHYLLNPSQEAIQDSKLNLVVAGTKEAVLMVESEADQLSEEEMLGAVLFGHEQFQVAIDAIHELAEKSQVEAWDWVAPQDNTALAAKVAEIAEHSVVAAYQIKEKAKRVERLKEIKQQVTEQLTSDEENDAKEIGNLLHDIEKRIVRQQILDGEPRIDGRATDDIRPITPEVGILPRTHGSALFTRGETQALVVHTLGTERDAQRIDELLGEIKDNFMLHYNFPPYCVGETGMMSGPKRREIGHGRLAKRALLAVIPSIEEFPYVHRVVSEITESNGSSSMASVCGTSLALMDAGVPIKAAVAGIAMGLIKDGNKFAILSDILGDEDHLGDMDFKVAGTSNGITALQMDIKIEGITREIMEKALLQAKAGRMHILGIMNSVISAPRQEMSNFAPRILTIKINPDKIRDVIGKGGATIREITETTNSTIDITDDGVVKIATVNQEDGQRALEMVEALTAEVEVGKIYEGKVVKIMDFGGFVEVLPGQQGLVHVSQIAEHRVEDVNEYLKEGQIIQVKVIEIDRQGRIRLSMKEAKITGES